MLTSLFGDLRSLRPNRAKANPSGEPDHGFAATAIMEHGVPDRGATHAEMAVDQHVRDLVVSGSPAQAIRDHFSATRADLGTASRQITLVDPTGAWAPSVIKALSDASGRPVERLHLREQGTLRTLAMIERTLLERRGEDPLRVYHADVRAPGRDNAAIPDALMESSHLTAVIVGALGPHAVDDMLISLYETVQRPNWRCPTLLFMLPPTAVWISNKIATIDWPKRVRVQSVNESLGSASAVWNSLLGMWNRVKSVPALPVAYPAADAASPQEDLLGGFPIRLGGFSPPVDLSPRSALAGGNSRSSPRPGLSIRSASDSLKGLLGIEGLLGCAVVDADTGLVLARQVPDNHPFQLDLAAAGAAQVLRAHRQAATDMGMPDDIEEVMTSGGERHQVLRTSSRHKGLFLFALLDKPHANLALTRYKLMEAEKALV
jgi:hypothetical protein